MDKEKQAAVVEEYYRKYQDVETQSEQKRDRLSLGIAAVGLLIGWLTIWQRGMHGPMVGAITYWTLSIVFQLLSHSASVLAHRKAAAQIIEEGIEPAERLGGSWTTFVCTLNVMHVVMCLSGLAYLLWFLS